MKKFLFSIAALALALTASASDILPTTSIEQYDPSDATTYKVVTLTLTNTTQANALQVYFHGVEDGTDILDCTVTESANAARDTTYKSGLKSVTSKLYTGSYKNTSNESDACPQYFLSWNANELPTTWERVPLLDGIVCKLWFPMDCTKTLKLTGLTDTKGDGGEKITESVVNLAEITAVSTVGADTAAPSTYKYAKNGSVVVVKNGKKFTAAGAQVK